MAASAERAGPCAAAVWEGLCQRLALPAEASRKWWQRLEASYGEGQRHYHTMEHITELLSWHEWVGAKGGASATATGASTAVGEHLPEAGPGWADPDGVLLALFFHDVVYDPRAGDNEERSCGSLEAFLEEAPGAAASTSALAALAILCTKVHSTDPPGTKRAPPARPVPEVRSSTGAWSTAAVGDLSDAALRDVGHFLDADMAILASPPPRYEEYAAQVRREFAHVDEMAFRSGRAAFLRATLATGTGVLSTDAFAGLNVLARRNMEWELAALEGEAP